MYSWQASILYYLETRILSQTAAIMPPKQEKCANCDKSVYAAERVEAGGRVYHKLCFKCSVCKMSVSLANYAQSDGILFCKTDYQKHVLAKNTQVAM